MLLTETGGEQITESLPFAYAGGLQVRYSLGGTREPFSIDADNRNMANGQPHSVNVTRHGRTVVLKVPARVHASCMRHSADTCL